MVVLSKLRKCLGRVDPRRKHNNKYVLLAWLYLRDMFLEHLQVGGQLNFGIQIFGRNIEDTILLVVGSKFGKSLCQFELT